MKVIKIRTPGRLPGRLYKSRAPALKWETAADAATASASAPAGGSFIRFTLASAAAAAGGSLIRFTLASAAAAAGGSLIRFALASAAAAAGGSFIRFTLASAAAAAGGSFIRFALASAAAADGAGAQTGAFVHCRTCGQKVVHLAAAAKALGPFADDSFTAGGAAAAIAVAVAVTAAGRFVCHVAAVAA